MRLFRTLFILALTAFCASAQSSVAVNPQEVRLSASAGATTPSVQTVTVLTTGENVSFTTDVRYPATPAGWLSVTPRTGNTPAVLTLSADASRLSPGTYIAQVTITAGRLGGFVNVLFTVGSAAGTAGLVVNSSALSFIALAGSTILSPQSLSVRSSTGAAVEFEAIPSSQGNWLTVSPTVATTPGTLTVGVLQGALAPGTYSGTIAITPKAGGTSIVVPVVLSLKTGTAGNALVLSQTAVSFNHQLVTAAPPNQRVVVNTTGVEVGYTATTSTSWLRLQAVTTTAPGTAISDQTPGDFDIIPDPAGLVPGTYIGSIIVSSPGLTAQQIPVSLTVTSTPALNVTAASSVVFELPPGSLASDLITLTSTGGATLTFSVTASPTPAWLTITPTSGTVESGGFQFLGLTVDSTGLAPGTYTTTLRFTIQGSIEPSLSIPVVLRVTGQSSETPILQVNAESIELTALVGGSNPSQFLNVSNSAAAPHEFTAAGVSPEGWLSVTPHIGVTPARLTVSADASAVRTAGTYEGSVVITSMETGQQRTVPVRLNLALQAIIAEPVSLAFEQKDRSTTPPSQSIRLDANAPSSFTVTASHPWLRVDPLRGSTPTAITVSVNPALGTPGMNRGTVKIAGPWNELSIPVTLSVLEPLGPTASPATLTFTHELGRPAPAAQPINVGSTGGPINFRVSAATQSGGNWLAVTPAAGLAPATVTASVNTSALIPGRHTGTITITSADGTAPARTVAVTLNVTTSGVSVVTILHGATFAPTAIAPGQIITITGAGLGPATGVTARPTAAGAIESRLGEVRVLFDGIPAPLLFVRTDQINAIVPYALYGRLSARVQVESGMSFSLPIEAKVADVAPGLFTANSSGRGQAAALNPDLTVNTPTNPALRGSVVAVYGSGEGQTDPLGQDGRIIITDLRKPLVRAMARVGGIPADVTYFGSAPMLVSGVFQANVRIPPEVEPGSVSIELEFGGATTQSGVTISVR